MISSTIHSNAKPGTDVLPKVIRIFSIFSRVRCYRQEEFGRNSHATFPRSKCTSYTRPLETRKNFCSLSLYQCGELTEYLSVGSVILETDFSATGTIIYSRYGR